MASKASALGHPHTFPVEFTTACAKSPLSPEHTKPPTYTWYYHGHSQSQVLAMWGQFNLMYAESQLKSQNQTSSQAMGHLCTSSWSTIILMKTTPYH